MMDFDETICGEILCQHPACWQTHLRFQRGIPHKLAPVKNPAEDEDEGLPTQKIVNLFGAFEDNDVAVDVPGNRKLSGRRSNSLPSLGSKSASYPTIGMMAPQVTPASPVRSMVNDVLRIHTKKEKPPQVLHTVEVQEVFDLDDLHMNWQDTFMAKKYYVWVDSLKSKQDGHHLSPLQHIPISRLKGGPTPLSTKDLTEKMVPQEVQYQREHTIVHDDVWPVIKEKKIRNTKSGGPIYSSRKSRERKILDDEITITSKEKLREMLDRVIPIVEKENTAISLATGEVLQQRKVQLHDVQSKMTKQTEPVQAKQVFLLDADDNAEKLSTTHDPDDMRDEMGDLSDLSSYRDSPTDLNKNRPLPPISGLENVHPPTTPRTKIPAISLGLPEIPPGIKVTKPFRYERDAIYDFKLDKVPTPPAIERARSETPLSPDPGSTIHVTVPSMATELDDMISPTHLDHSLDRVSQRQLSKDYSFDTSPNISPTTPMTSAQSRQSATEAYYNPHQLLGEATALTLSSTKSHLYRDTSLGSGMGQPRPPVNTPNVGPKQFSMLSPEHTGLLDTIHETDHDTGQASEKSSRHHDQQLVNKAVRTVRFAPETPAPASTPRDADSVFIVPPVQSPLYSNSPNRRQMSMTGSPGLSPEPWPMVEEEDYMGPPSPLRNPSPINVTLPTADSHVQPVPASRESSYHAELMKKIKGGEAVISDSPAPPPPSPEPGQRRPGAVIMKDGIPMSILEEVLETDSELTLSALPPSNLDDNSGITTPADLSAHSRPTSKGDPQKLGEGLLNVESLARSRPASKGDPVGTIEEEPQEWARLSTVNEHRDTPEQIGRQDNQKWQSREGDMSGRNEGDVIAEERGEITEDGGDNAAFKDELREELQKYSE